MTDYKYAKTCTESDKPRYERDQLGLLFQWKCAPVYIRLLFATRTQQWHDDMTTLEQKQPARLTLTAMFSSDSSSKRHSLCASSSTNVCWSCSGGADMVCSDDLGSDSSDSKRGGERRRRVVSCGDSSGKTVRREQRGAPLRDFKLVHLGSWLSHITDPWTQLATCRACLPNGSVSRRNDRVLLNCSNVNHCVSVQS